MTSVM